MPLNPNESIAANTPFTPAERAVLVEKSEGLKVALDTFIQKCKDDTPQHLVESLIPCAQEWDDIKNLVATKLSRTIMEDILQSLGSDH